MARGRGDYDTSSDEAVLLATYKQVIRDAWDETRDILRAKIESAHVVFVEAELSGEMALAQIETAEDVAETLIFFLIGAGSRLSTGETLIVDSGIHLGPLPPYASGEDQ